MEDDEKRQRGRLLGLREASHMVGEIDCPVPLQDKHAAAIEAFREIMRVTLRQTAEALERELNDKLDAAS